MKFTKIYKKFMQNYIKKKSSKNNLQFYYTIIEL